MSQPSLRDLMAPGMPNPTLKGWARVSSSLRDQMRRKAFSSTAQTAGEIFHCNGGRGIGSNGVYDPDRHHGREEDLKGIPQQNRGTSYTWSNCRFTARGGSG